MEDQRRRRLVKRLFDIMVRHQIHGRFCKADDVFERWNLWYFTQEGLRDHALRTSAQIDQFKAHLRDHR